MGIQGLHGELGPTERTALTKLALVHHTAHSRRLRIAIDASIWSFQVESARGGPNPALRTLYYRLLRLLHHNISPLFIFDGPNRPAFKRGQKTNTHLTPTLIRLCKKLLKHFGVPFHTAPGEAEAECALLQREGVVDAVLSEDVDTLMFGASRMFKNWSSEGTGSKTPTHVTILDSAVIQTHTGLDRDGIVLVALMRGGDYLPEGVPGCGIKTAVEAARAGFGADLAAVSGDPAQLEAWRERLQTELMTNKSGHFKRKNGRVKIPADFPDAEVLGYYRSPCVSSVDKVGRIRDALVWDGLVDVVALREYARDTFEWRGTLGAAKFVRTLAPVLVSRWMHDATPDAARVLQGLHGKRDHPSTDGCPELRVSYMPDTVIPIDKDRETEDDELEAQEQAGVLDDDEASEEGGAKTKSWSPYETEKQWMLDAHVRRAVAEKVAEWESAKSKSKSKSKKPAAKPKATRSKKAAPTTATGGMRHGSMERYLAATDGNRATPPPVVETETAPKATRKANSPTKTRPTGQLPFKASKSAAAAVAAAVTTEKEAPPAARQFIRPLSPPPPRPSQTRPQTPPAPSTLPLDHSTSPDQDQDQDQDPTAALCKQVAAIDISDSEDEDMVLRRPASVVTPVRAPEPVVRRTRQTTRNTTRTTRSTRSTRSQQQQDPADVLAQQMAVIVLDSDDDDELPPPEKIVSPTKLQKQLQKKKIPQVTKRLRVALRESLPGSWCVLAEGEVVEDERKVWEGVEVLDLTEI